MRWCAAMRRKPTAKSVRELNMRGKLPEHERKRERARLAAAPTRSNILQ
jgi:hypothetical protein